MSDINFDLDSYLEENCDLNQKYKENHWCY